MAAVDVLQFGTRPAFPKAKSQPELAVQARHQQQSEPVDAKELYRRLDQYKKELDAEKKRRRKTAGHQASETQRPKSVGRPLSFDRPTSLFKGLDFHRRDDSKSNKLFPSRPKTAAQRLSKINLHPAAVSTGELRLRSEAQISPPPSGARPTVQRGETLSKESKRHSRHGSSIVNPRNLLQKLEDHYGTRKSHSKSTNDLSNFASKDEDDLAISPTIAAFIKRTLSDEQDKKDIPSPLQSSPPKVDVPASQASPRPPTTHTTATHNSDGFFTPPSRLSYELNTLSKRSSISPLEQTPIHSSGQSTPRQLDSHKSFAQPAIVTRPGARSTVTIVKPQLTPPRSPTHAPITSISPTQSSAGVITEAAATVVIRPVPSDLPKISTVPTNPQTKSDVRPVLADHPKQATKPQNVNLLQTETKDFAMDPAVPRRGSSLVQNTARPQTTPEPPFEFPIRSRPMSTTYVPRSAATSHARTTAPLPSGDSATRINRLSQHALDQHRLESTAAHQEQVQSAEAWNRALAARQKDQKRRQLVEATVHDKLQKRLEGSETGETQRGMMRPKSMPLSPLQKRPSQVYNMPEGTASLSSIPESSPTTARSRSHRALKGQHDEKATSQVDLIACVVDNFSTAMVKKADGPVLVNVASAVEGVRRASTIKAQDDERPVSQGNGENVLRWKERAMREKAIQASRANSRASSMAKVKAKTPGQPQLQSPARIKERATDEKLRNEGEVLTEQAQRPRSTSLLKRKKSNQSLKHSGSRSGDAKKAVQQQETSHSRTGSKKENRKSKVDDPSASTTSLKLKKSPRSLKSSKSTRSKKDQDRDTPEIPDRYSMTPESWAFLEKQQQALRRKTHQEAEIRRVRSLTASPNMREVPDMGLPTSMTFPMASASYSDLQQTIPRSMTASPLSYSRPVSRPGSRPYVLPSSTSQLDLVRTASSSRLGDRPGEWPDQMAEPKSMVIDMSSHRGSVGLAKAESVLGLPDEQTSGFDANMVSAWSSNEAVQREKVPVGKMEKEHRGLRKLLCF